MVTSDRKRTSHAANGTKVLAECSPKIGKTWGKTRLPFSCIVLVRLSVSSAMMGSLNNCMWRLLLAWRVSPWLALVVQVGPLAGSWGLWLSAVVSFEPRDSILFLDDHDICRRPQCFGLEASLAASVFGAAISCGPAGVWSRSYLIHSGVWFATGIHDSLSRQTCSGFSFASTRRVPEWRQRGARRRMAHGENWVQPYEHSSQWRERAPWRPICNHHERLRASPPGAHRVATLDWRAAIAAAKKTTNMSQAATYRFVATKIPTA